MTIATAPVAPAGARYLQTELFSTRFVPVGLTVDARRFGAQSYGVDEPSVASRPGAMPDCHTASGSTAMTWEVGDHLGAPGREALSRG